MIKYTKEYEKRFKQLFIIFENICNTNIENILILNTLNRNIKVTEYKTILFGKTCYFWHIKNKKIMLTLARIEKRYYRDETVIADTLENYILKNYKIDLHKFELELLKSI